jgi:chromobox protein 1
VEKSGRKRKSLGEPQSSPDKAAPKKTRKSTNVDGTETPEENEAIINWAPKGKNWEREVSEVETIIRDPETGSLMAYLEWVNGKKSRVSIEQCYEKCPMKVCYQPMV